MKFHQGDIPDKKRVTETQTRALDTSKCYGERLAEGSLFERNVVGQLVEPLGWVQMPASERTYQV